MSSSSSSSNFQDKDEAALRSQDVTSSRRVNNDHDHGDGPHVSVSKESNIPDATYETHQQKSIDLQRKSTHNSTTKAMADSKKELSEIAAPETNDPNIVGWSGPDDPQNPMNFSPKLKLLNIGLVSAICFVTPLASSMFAPGVPELMREFGSRSNELGSFVVSGKYFAFRLHSAFCFQELKLTNSF